VTTDTVARLSVSLPRSMRQAIRMAAAAETRRTGETVTTAEWLRRAVAERLERQPRKDV
jgi:hypothetical protein